MTTGIKELKRELHGIKGDLYHNGSELGKYSVMELENEAERDLECQLKSKLENINKKLHTITVILSGASSRENKIATKDKVLTLIIPNSLLSLW